MNVIAIDNVTTINSESYSHDGYENEKTWSGSDSLEKGDDFSVNLNDGINDVQIEENHFPFKRHWINQKDFKNSFTDRPW